MSDQTIAEQMIALELHVVRVEAKRAGITLDKGDVVWTEMYGATIDGMPAAQWLEAMTMD